MSIDIDKILVSTEYSLRQALEILDAGAKGIIFVVDKDKKLLGTITDGDVRRALLQGMKLNESIDKITNRRPISIRKNMTKENVKDIFIRKAIKDLPVVDDENVVIDIISINDILLPEGKENPVVIMAGGLGSRLKELTEEIPKPMLRIGQDPILQHIINNFKLYGYNKVFISVNYKSEIIENYFQDGYAYGVKIEYIKENKRLGTAGGIKLAKSHISRPFFVINGDIFTNMNVENMMNFHVKNKYDITIGTRRHSFQIPYGIVEKGKSNVKCLKEKPTISYLINGGVYCVNPELMELIPNNEYYEITDLINASIEKGYNVGSYEIKEYWMDIGKREDYNKVNEDIFELECKKKVGDLNNKG